MWFQQIDPRVKFLTSLIFIVSVVQLESLTSLVVASIFPLCLLVLTRTSVVTFAKRMTWILPFAGVMALVFPFIRPGEALYVFDLGFVSLEATREGLHQGLMLILRAGTAAATLIILSLSTGNHALLRALEALKVPSILIRIIEFTLRYMEVLKEEVERMQIARKARNYRAGKNIWHKRTIETIGQLIGVLFLRSVNRGERVYTAMLARGYRGHIPSCCQYQLKPLDYCYGVGGFGVAVLLLVLERGGWQWLQL